MYLLSEKIFGLFIPDSGFGSRFFPIPDPDPDFFPSRIRIPGSKKHRIPDPQHF
jgi:hypothetical protein